MKLTSKDWLLVMLNDLFKQSQEMMKDSQKTDYVQGYQEALRNVTKEIKKL